jgi:hypothetical protein
MISRIDSPAPFAVILNVALPSAICQLPFCFYSSILLALLSKYKGSEKTELE